ncbi:MAG TPA: transporter substrate-binding domain-containing protein [Spirochaetota bacterium]|nr:transporter substrate-binding domain-containing protein [Spirochaetota bacterium]HPF07015.1 transporter substrate-binding domain-containing protein [Spirochaetota bacterium]HPJ41064.1 transporter substrate-binding domain-containing protein [Spirochaetota bacterium]HPR36350.1 transporter substrate-binding domain-containing protein [Spirochaetota bacterium]HRX47493.1 transporter substrate-binding domain-containing protein [Spirochaetota bacterium]
MKHVVIITLVTFSIFCKEISAVSADIIKYAVFPAPPYMIDVDDESRELSGIDIDIMREIAKRGGYEIRFIRAPWKRVIELIKNGDADMLSSTYLTPERKKHMLYFDRPYLRSLPIAFYYRKDSKIKIEKYTDLYAFSEIGVLRGASYFRRFDTDPKINRVEISTQEQLYPMLIHRRINIMAGYVPTENYFIQKYRCQNTVARSEYVYNEPSNVYMAISRKSVLIKKYYKLNSINTALYNEGFIKKTVSAYYKKYNPYITDYDR